MLLLYHRVAKCLLGTAGSTPRKQWTNSCDRWTSRSTRQHLQQRTEVAMSIVVRNFEAGSNLKLISKTLKAVAHSTPPSAYVCVGDTIDTEEPDFLKGHGTALVDGRLIATLCGVVQRVDKLIYVQPVKSRYSPEVGDVVVGRVTEVSLQQQRWQGSSR
eukprot:GHRQ01024510.1.p1 GENE.GHRQ01024510.1~~GHRQ01024510.1.p1  ORF type:complete len:159 (+),score=26.11 GHRQ01024510.1:101-577(+)